MNNIQKEEVTYPFEESMMDSFPSSLLLYLEYNTVRPNRLACTSSFGATARSQPQMLLQSQYQSTGKLGSRKEGEGREIILKSRSIVRV